MSGALDECGVASRKKRCKTPDKRNGGEGVGERTKTRRHVHSRVHPYSPSSGTPGAMALYRGRGGHKSNENKKGLMGRAKATKRRKTAFTYTCQHSARTGSLCALCAGTPAHCHQCMRWSTPPHPQTPKHGRRGMAVAVQYGSNR